jgi:hypothetical protein
MPEARGEGPALVVGGDAWEERQAAAEVRKRIAERSS